MRYEFKPILLASLIAFVWLLPALGFAQSTIKLEGYITSETGEPLEGVNVVVSGTGIGTASDASGYYFIENLFAGTYLLRASHMGYRGEQRHVSIQKDGAARVDFELQSVPIAFKEVVVEERFTRESDSQFRESITSEEIKKSHAQTVADLLVDHPGVNVIDEGGGSGQKRVAIRGSNANQVLVLFDGVPLSDPVMGETDLSQIPLAWVERINIWKGGNGSRFGNGAIGGVIEILSRKSGVDEIGVTGELGSYGALAVRPFLAGKLKKIKFLLNFEQRSEKGNYPYSYQRLDNNLVVHARRHNSDYSSQNYFGKINFDFGRQAVQLQANLFHSDRGLPGKVFFWTPFARAETERRILVGKYRFQSSSWLTTIQASHHLKRSELMNDSPDGESASVPDYHTRYQIQSYQGMVESELHPSSGPDLFFQAKLQRDDFEDENLLSGSAGAIRDTKNLSYALSFRAYIDLPHPGFLSDFKLNQAIRFDGFSFDHSATRRNDNLFSPHTGLFIAKRGSWNVSFKMNYGQSFRVPTFADLFFQDFRVEGNPGLQPEKSRDFDAGLQVGFPALGWFEMSAAYFRHDIENFITWELGSFGVFRPSNSDALLKGWEFGTSWQLFSKLDLTFDHTILNTFNKNPKHTVYGKALPFRPHHSTKIGARLTAAGFSLNYRKRLVGKRFVNASNQIYMPGYSVDDLTFSYEPSFKNLRTVFKVSVFNLFDEEYEIIEGAPLPGRHWRTSVEFRY